MLRLLGEKKEGRKDAAIGLRCLSQLFISEHFRTLERRYRIQKRAYCISGHQDPIPDTITHTRLADVQPIRSFRGDLALGSTLAYTTIDLVWYYLAYHAHSGMEEVTRIMMNPIVVLWT